MNRYLLAFMLLVATAVAAPTGYLYWVQPDYFHAWASRPDGTLASQRLSSDDAELWELQPASGGFHVRNHRSGQWLGLHNGQPAVSRSPAVWTMDDDFLTHGDTRLMLRRSRLASAPPPTDVELENSHDGQRVGPHHGGLWQVIVSSLRGHTSPDASSAVVRHFPRGTVLEANIGRGGSDEVSLNAVDDQGHAWMPVYNGSEVYNCWVECSLRYLRPVREKP